MPGYAGAGRNCSKLVNDVSRNKVDVIVSQADGGIFHTFSSQLVKFCIINPANTLKYYETKLLFCWTVLHSLYFWKANSQNKDEFYSKYNEF